MRVYITNINGQSIQSTAQLCQNTVTDVAVSLGYRELGIYCYQIHTDSESELSKRLDGIVAGLRHGDVVIFQTPTWNTTEFDEKLMNKLKLYDIKIVLFIHDVVPLMFSGNFYLMDRTIAYYNKADVVVAPSQKMIDKLRDFGLNVSKTVVQGMWDHPTQAPMFPAGLKREIHFPGNPERFSFVKEWKYDIPLKVYTCQNVELPQNVHKINYRPDEQLLMEMSQGGFGLVWMDDKDKEYQSLYCSYKLGSFLAAGIPVIVQEGIANQELIENNGLGWIVKDVEEAIMKVKNVNEDEYIELVKNVRSFNPILRKGFFTRRLLTESVFQAICD